MTRFQKRAFVPASSKRRAPFAPAELLRGFWGKAGVGEDRIAILNSVWEREVGAYRAHWRLDGVTRGVVHVRVKSSASGQELALRSRELVRNLNKHFRSPWIKAVRFKVGLSPSPERPRE